MQLSGNVSKEDLLLEVEEVIRLTPDQMDFGTGKEPTLMWIGRAAAALERWDFTKTPTISHAVIGAQSFGLSTAVLAFVQLKTMLWQARADLRTEIGQLS